MSNHAFDIEVAKEYGMKEAVLIAHFQFWLKKNAADNRNQHDGRFWSYNTTEVIAQSFPYLSINEVRNGINALVKAGVLLKANYNRAAYDQTRWYAFQDQEKWLFSDENATQAANELILQNCEMDLAELQNPFGEIAKPIPDTNPVNNTDIKNLIITDAVKMGGDFVAEQQAADTIELTAEQQECFDWATVHSFWFASTVSIIRFLKVYNRNVEGGLKQQFDAHKKAQSAIKHTGLNSEIHYKKTGGNYETRSKFNQHGSLSKHDQQQARFEQAREQAMAEWRANNAIVIN